MANKNAVGLACQLAFEYENPDWEHVSDMLATYEDERPPCDGDTLHDLMNIAVKHKNEGKTYEETSKLLMKCKV